MVSVPHQIPPLLNHVSPVELGARLPSLKIISYRGPGQSGGVSKVLEPLLQQIGTKVQWVAMSGLPKTGDDGSFSFYLPDVSASIVEGHARFCTGYLWPLLHGMGELAQFDADGWRSYKQLNAKLAMEALNVSGDSFPSIYWGHDYHVALVASIISAESGIIPCQFWHVPWPEPSVIKQSPIAQELVEGLLCNDLIGFHTQEYADNFLNTAKEIFPDAVVESGKLQVKLGSHLTRVVVMPLGIDFNYWQRLAKDNRQKASAISKNYSLANQVILGIDRLDYTKGVLEKLFGLEQFLTDNAQWMRRFHFVQLAQPAQSQLPAYEDYASKVKAKVKQINKRFGNGTWEPVIYLEEQLTPNDLAAWYQAADVLAVTPTRDGLNLIAKEYVACRQDEQGVIVLSQHAGAVAELSGGAILVDPTNVHDLALGFEQALTMGMEEKRRRMLSMRHVVAWNQLHDWALAFLQQAVSR